MRDASLEAIQKTVESQLEGLTKSGVIRTSEVTKVQTLHQSKNLRARLKDWFLWKTPLRRWTVKQFGWVQEDLADHLEYWAEYKSEMRPEEVETFLNQCRGHRIWVQHYWEDPYSIVLTDVSFVPVKPIEFIKMDIQI